jgi:hypothetical protein
VDEHDPQVVADSRVSGIELDGLAEVLEGGAVLADAGRGPRDFLLISLAEGLSLYRGHPEKGGEGVRCDGKSSEGTRRRRG